MPRFAILAEKADIPSVIVEWDVMTDNVTSWALRFGCPVLRRVIADKDVPKEKREEEARRILRELVKALTAPLTEKEKDTSPLVSPKRSRAAFTGTYDEVQEFFIGNIEKYKGAPPQSEMTDGLPVVPPTEERVEEMLKGTSHDRHEVVGTMSPLNLDFDVEKVAINAVMAGCKSEHLPILLTIASTGLGDISGGHFSQRVWIVSGPIAKEVRMNWMHGYMSPGNVSNASLGRAYALMRKNLGGTMFNVTTGNETGRPEGYSAVWAENIWDRPPGWTTTLGEDFGFERDQSVLIGLRPSTWHGKLWFGNWWVESPENARSSLDHLIDRFSVIDDQILIGLMPEIAKLEYELNERDKQAYKQYIYEHYTTTIGRFKWGILPFQIKQKFAGRELRGKSFDELPDDTVVRRLRSPDDIALFLAGAPRENLIAITGMGFVVELIDKWR